jgi:hypothetical protein
MQRIIGGKIDVEIFVWTDVEWFVIRFQAIRSQSQSAASVDKVFRPFEAGGFSVSGIKRNKAVSKTVNLMHVLLYTYGWIIGDSILELAHIMHYVFAILCIYREC